jgi:hypothetical protein
MPQQARLLQSQDYGCHILLLPWSSSFLVFLTLLSFAKVAKFLDFKISRFKIQNSKFKIQDCQFEVVQLFSWQLLWLMADGQWLTSPKVAKP